MIKLFFENATIEFHESAEKVRGRRYDLSKFGEIKGGEGDGWEEVVSGFISIVKKPSYYGHCPICGARVKTRERRINGNDTCMNGHVFPSKDAV
jgi:hypothetical protein